MGNPTYSFVVPIFNEEETLPELYRRLSSVASGLDGRVQIIFVDDGSRDRSLEQIRQLQKSDQTVTYISLARNFGHQVAISAGLQAATGDATIVLDGDLQDPPELIPALIAEWKNGFQVVYAQRTSQRSGRTLKTSAAFAFYRLFRRVTSVDIPVDAGDFCLMDRRVVDVLRQLPERSRYLRGLRAWTGFRSTAVPFTRDARFSGESKYTYGKLIGLATSGVVSFSRFPLRLALYAGALAGTVALIAGSWAMVSTLLHGISPGRREVLIFAGLTFFGAVQLVCLGFVGEYVGRIYDEVRGRPLFIVKEAAGVEWPAGGSRGPG